MNLVAEEMLEGMILQRGPRRYVVVDWGLTAGGHVMEASLVRLGSPIWPFRRVWTIDDSRFDEFKIESIPRVYLGKPLPAAACRPLNRDHWPNREHAVRSICTGEIK